SSDLFQVRESIMYSNVATATINLTEASGELPPVIVGDPFIQIVLNGSGNGHAYISSTITDPNGNLDTILWEFVGTPYPNTTIGAETTTFPLIDIIAGENGLFSIKCTATDTLGNWSEAIVAVLVGSYIIEAGVVQIVGSSGSDTESI